MDHEDEFLNTFFTQVAQLCSEKAKETVVSKDNKNKKFVIKKFELLYALM